MCLTFLVEVSAHFMSARFCGSNDEVRLLISKSWATTICSSQNMWSNE